MKREKELVAEVETEKTPDETVENLKKVAHGFKKYFNEQYKEAVSYVPDTDTIASVTVSKWLNLPKAIQDVTELPGLPFGNVTCIYGKPDTGKTTFVQTAIAACQKQGVLPILILTEHKFDFNRLSKFMGADPEAMLVFHPNNLEQGYAYVEKILKDVKAGHMVIEDDAGNDVKVDLKDQDVFIFWDSIGNTLSESELEYEVEDWDKSMGKSAKAIKTLTKRVNQLLSKVRSQVGICFLNQSYQSMPQMGPSIETPFGGEGVPYSSALVLRFRRVGDLRMTVKGKDIIVGLETKIEVKKNHITHKRPIGSLLTVATGMIENTDAAYDAYKKKIK